MLAITNGLCDAGVRVAIHGFTDGRDVLPRIAGQSVADFARTLPNNSAIATIIGRYYAMDRDKRWDRTKCAFDAIISASTGQQPFASATDAIVDAYDAGESDEFIRPRVVGNYAGMQDGDALIFINFRADRARQLLNAMLLPETVGFDAAPPKISTAIGMTTYSDTLATCMQTLFPPLELTKTLGEVVAAAGRRQLRLAETEKYPHVTFFFNGGDETSQPDEDRCMVQSPMVATYDQQPEMNAEGVLAAALDSINTRQHDLIIVNFANPDMVGHTGDLQAAITAVETVDDCVGQIANALVSAGGQMLLTADHGNCEVMWDDQNDSPHTAHTTNLVPLILVNASPSATIVDGRLADLAPSLLEMLGIAKPGEMTGTSLLR
jgi:2,3-bisphosphoglycerate-independent phosphoglycerate mutase